MQSSLINQPTYDYLNQNFEQLKLDLIQLISQSTKESIIEGAIAQATKGLAKYGMTIDDNLTFPAREYLQEELFDAFVYLANLQVRNLGGKK